jgi:hypothetical protein
VPAALAAGLGQPAVAEWAAEPRRARAPVELVAEVEALVEAEPLVAGRRPAAR